MSGDVELVLDEARAWLRANGIDPNDVPLSHVPTVRRRRITCQVFSRTEGGRIRFVDDEAVTQERVVPLKVKPPAVLFAWLGLR